MALQFFWQNRQSTCHCRHIIKGACGKSMRLFPQPDALPVAGFRCPAPFHPKFLRLEGQKAFAKCMLIVLDAPLLIFPEQFPRPYGTSGPLDTVFPDEVPEHVHLVTVFLGRLVNGYQAPAVPTFFPLNEPGQNTGPFFEQFFFKMFVLSVRRDSRGKRNQLYAPPYPVVRPLYEQLMVCGHKYLESRYEIKKFPVQEPGRQRVVAGNLFYERLRKPLALFRFSGID